MYIGLIIWIILIILLIGDNYFFTMLGMLVVINILLILSKTKKQRIWIISIALLVVLTYTLLSLDN